MTTIDGSFCRLVLLGLVLSFGCGRRCWAIDHSNLDGGRPLRLEDAYAISSGEVVVESGAGLSVPRRGSARGVFPVQALYGLFPNTQLGLETTLTTDPHETGGQPRPGDLGLSALYNLNQETLELPAFGIESTLGFPTGVDSAGVDLELKGLVTKSLGRLSFHFNGGYAFLSGEPREERDGRYEFALGASYPIGAPKHTRTVLLADIFLEQSDRRGATQTWGSEVGVRYQFTQRMVLDAGVGSEIAGPRERSVFYFTAGMSLGF